MTEQTPPSVGPASAAEQATHWMPDDVAAIEITRAATAPTITQADVKRVAPDLDIWDAWPVQTDDGAPAVLDAGATLWMALGSPRFPDPDDRHGHARIHLLELRDGAWRHLGPVMPDGFSPGSREWSGSAVVDDDARTLTLYFTVTGRRDEATLTFEQRLFRARANLHGSAGDFRLDNWRDLDEIVERDPAYYMASDEGEGAVGTIKAFRDPAYFRDPADGRQYLFFAGSRAGAASEFNGVIGAAVAKHDRSGWDIMPPLVDATGVNNELERPHVILCDGRYYLFWSTQTHVFDPGGPMGPTGLYGMVASSLNGPWRLLNGTGLVFANPSEAPRQAYSWLVLPDLSVISFIDDWGVAPADSGPRRFGATFAPLLQLDLRDDWAGLRG